MQTRRHSAVEAITGTCIGFVTAFATQAIVFPLYGLPVGTATNLQLTGIFTLVSIVRGYAVRRVFNRIHHWSE